MYAKHVEEGLRLLGAHKLLGVFLESVKLFPQGEVPVNWDERLYKESGVEERLYPCFKAYIDQHLNEFFTD